MHEQLGQIMTTRYKKTKIQLPLLRCQERKHDATHDSCTGHHQGRGQTTWASNPVQSTHLPLHSLTPCKKPGHTPWRVSKCTCFLFSSPCAAAQVPVKPCLDVSSDLLSVSTEERAQGLRWVIHFSTVCGRGVEAIWCPLLGEWADRMEWVPNQEYQQHWRVTNWMYSWLDPKTAPSEEKEASIQCTTYFTRHKGQKILSKHNSLAGCEVGTGMWVRSWG